MSFSGFNKGQSGNATEVGAGVVKLATQAQVDSGDADEGGVPLVVTPDKIPSPTTIGIYNAYEDLVKGDVVGVSWYAPGADADVFSTSLTTATVTPSQLNWFAQEFVYEDPAFLDISNLAVYAQNNYVATLSNVTIRIRETLTGADIATTVIAWAGGSAFAPITVSGLLTPGNTYYILVSYDAAPGSDWKAYRDPSGASTPPGVVGTGCYASTDGGANWSIQTYCLQVRIRSNQVQSLGHNKVFKASAADITSNRFGVMGVVKADALAGNPVSIETGKNYEGLFSGLTDKLPYFLSDTPGQVSLTPGTFRILLGQASGVDTIIRDFTIGEVITVPGHGSDATYYCQGMFRFINTDSSSPRQFNYTPRIDYDGGDVSYGTAQNWDIVGGGSVDVIRGVKIYMEGGDARKVQIIFPT